MTLAVAHNLEKSVSPTWLPVSVNEVISDVSLDDDAETRQEVTRLIEAVAERFQSELSMQFAQATYLLKSDGFPMEFELRRPPVQSVSSIAYLDEDGNSQTASSSIYRVTQTDTHNAPGLVTLDYSQSWPSVRGVSRDVTVTFVCGWASQSVIPHQIRSLIKFGVQQEIDGCDNMKVIDRLLASLRWTV